MKWLTPWRVLRDITIIFHKKTTRKGEGIITDIYRHVLTIGFNRNCDTDSLPSQGSLDAFSLDTLQRNGELITAENAAIGWGIEKAVISNATFIIRQGSVTIIQGGVASGKTTLLKSFLGLGVIKKGSLSNQFAKAGYSSQDPWLMKGTIRQNIIGPSNFDISWYKTVLDICALNQDISRMGQGDETLIGGDGIRLSGGQQTRLVSFSYQLYFNTISLSNIFVID